MDPLNTELLKRALEAAAASQLEAAHNLANADTPGYRARRTDFRERLISSAPRGAGFQLYLEAVSGREGVQVERELARLSRATLEHAALVRLLNSRYEMIRAAIGEGRG